MNLEKVFNFIKVKRGYNYPLKYKLINGLPLSDDELNVKGTLDLRRTKITSLPDNFKVGDSLDLYYSDITSLGDNLHIGGYLDLSNTKITSLGDNLKVGDNLYICYTNITSLPDNLKVGGSLDLRNTPLSDKYNKEEIRKIIENKAGFVKGGIYK